VGIAWPAGRKIFSVSDGIAGPEIVWSIPLKRNQEVRAAGKVFGIPKIRPNLIGHGHFIGSIIIP
jgi:hypothetical protein